MDTGGVIDCIYCDFKKAFDKVPHRRLINKVESYGIKGEILGWITAFLSNRTQQVIVNGELSEFKKVTSGIPQGSVLGPLLFVIFLMTYQNKLTLSATFLQMTQRYSEKLKDQMTTLYYKMT